MVSEVHNGFLNQPTFQHSNRRSDGFDQNAVRDDDVHNTNIGESCKKVVFSEKLKISGNMGQRQNDEYEIDFENPQAFSVSRWLDILSNVETSLTSEDIELASKCQTWETFQKEIHTMLNKPQTTPVMKKHLAKIRFFPHTLAQLAKTFSRLVEPLDACFKLVWGLLSANLEYSWISPKALERTCDLMYKIRRTTETFNRSLEVCDVKNEAMIAIVDFLDPFIIILADSIAYYHEYLPGAEADEAWPDLSETIRQQLFNLESTVKHVNDISSYSKVNQERKAKHLSLRHALIAENEETGIFPTKRLPFGQINPRFYGRGNELGKIVKHLSPKDDGSLRTYTIYGKRGIGKTEIALHFAHKNPAGYDALFWIACETSVTIRESFTLIAKALKLPGADGNLPHEENLLKVHSWLKRTKKKWLLIFDNAEREALLQPYWPVAASGAILITSRQYFNFSKDIERKGETIKPFGTVESYDLLLQFLGEDWQRNHLADRIPSTEVIAAKSLLVELEGLALAIKQAATVIADPDIGGPNIVLTYDLFRRRNEQLQIANKSSGSTSIMALNALWDITFTALGPDERSLLSVLAWLSPDEIPIQLFLPIEQDALEPLLVKFRQDSRHIDRYNRASIVNLAPTKTLLDALQALTAASLLKNHNLKYSIHRVVQEAVNNPDSPDLQGSFNMACRLVFEQFPKLTQDNNELFSQWSSCTEHIAHGVYLTKKFVELARSGKIKGSKYFVKLLTNCSQYLYESGDFDTTEKLLEAGYLACDDKTSTQFARLRNVAGSRFFDLNRLADCRKAWGESLKILKAHLPADSRDVANMHHNLGNLELADGEVQASLALYEQAKEVYARIGDSAINSISLTYLCIGRAQMMQGKLDEALKTTNLSEGLMKHVSGSDKGFLVNVHYAYGNIYYRQKDYETAIRSYEECLKICQFTKPIHPIIIAIYFSLACVTFDMNLRDVAKGHLDRAKEIAELRSPRYDDGPIARINWKTAVVLESYPYGEFQTTASELRDKAMAVLTNLKQSGEGGRIPAPDENDADTYNETELEEDLFDALVPLFYR